MSDPHITHDWGREIIAEIVGEAELSDEDLDEILNGQAEVLDRKPVSIENLNPYEILIERYGLSEDEAYSRMMNIMAEDMDYWMPEDQEPPLNPAKPINFSHEVSTDYSRAEDGLGKQRSHYGAAHPDTGEIIIHSFVDEYVKQRELEGDE